MISWKLLSLITLAALNGLAAFLCFTAVEITGPKPSDALGLILGVANALFFIWASFEALMTWRGR